MGRPFYLFGGGIGTAEGDVMTDRIGEEKRLLGNKPDTFPESV